MEWISLLSWNKLCVTNLDDFVHWEKINHKAIYQINEIIKEKLKIKLTILKPNNLNNERPENTSTVTPAPICCACNLIFATKVDEDHHNKKIHQSKEKCAECQTFFTSKESLNKHKLLKHSYLYASVTNEDVFKKKNYAIT